GQRFDQGQVLEGGAMICPRQSVSGGGVPHRSRTATTPRGRRRVGPKRSRGHPSGTSATDTGSVHALVTSQDEGEAPFEVWHLPRDITEHVEGLLRLYLGEEAGAAIAQRLTASGLMSSLRSGYDVRLMADLAAANSTGSELPQDRVALYANADFRYG